MADDAVHRHRGDRWADVLCVAPVSVAFDSWADDPGTLGRAALDVLRRRSSTR